MPRGPGGTVAPATRTESDAEVATPSAEYVVDRIVRHCTARGGVEYKVRWYGHVASDDTYEPAEGLPNSLSTDIGAALGHTWPDRQDDPARTHRESPRARARLRARTRFATPLE